MFVPGVLFETENQEMFFKVAVCLSKEPMTHLILFSLSHRLQHVPFNLDNTFFFTHRLKFLHLTIDRTNKIPITYKTLCMFTKGFHKFPDLLLCIAGVRDGANKQTWARQGQ